MTKQADNIAALQQNCFHCGQNIPDDLQLSTEISGELRVMCCYGCLAVAEAIVAAGQQEFYQHRTDYASQGALLVPEFLQELEIYNNAEIQKSFVFEHKEGLREAALLLEGISCAACVWLNEKYIGELAGVESVQINYATHRAQVVWDDTKIQLSDILAAIRSIGYSAHPYDPEQQHGLLQHERRSALKRIGVAGVLGMQVMMISVALYFGDWSGMKDEYRNLFHWVAFLFTVPVLVYCASPFYVAAVRDLKLARMGMDVPVALGMSIAFVFSVKSTISGHGPVYFDSVVMFTFFLLIARFFEFRAREKASDVNERLSRITPATAHKINKNSGQLESVAVAELEVGDLVRVFAGETIPADGTIEEGRSGVDESILTGESLPKECSVGQKVIGGSLNTESPLSIRVEKIGQQTVLSHILRLMERAQHEKPAIAQLANRIAGRFVMAILMFAAMASAYWYSQGSDQWLPVMISLLVVTCPCALSLATPAAMTASTGALASKGLLVTRGHALETLSKATDIIFDKTGTLTDGRLRLHSITNFSSFSDEQMLQLAASLESDSEHLLGRALVGEAQLRDLSIDSQSLIELRNHPGNGITAIYRSELLIIGSLAFIYEKSGFKLSDAELQSLLSDGKSLVALANSEQILAVFTLGDKLRTGAKELVQYLISSGRQVHIFTGDHQSAALRVANSLGITRCQYAMSPSQKLNEMRRLQDQGGVVAMVGDGINDSPVLAGAQVSIAMGSAAQLTKFNADMVLVSNSLLELQKGFIHSNNTVNVIKQNLLWAVAYNILAIPAAAAGLIAPWMAAIGMSLSSLIVVLNSARLRNL